jgi:hypothetical protein
LDLPAGVDPQDFTGVRIVLRILPKVHNHWDNGYFSRRGPKFYTRDSLPRVRDAATNAIRRINGELPKNTDRWRFR